MLVKRQLDNPPKDPNPQPGLVLEQLKAEEANLLSVALDDVENASCWINQENVWELFSLVQEYGLEILQQATLSFLEKNVNRENLAQYLYNSSFHGLESVHQESIKILQKISQELTDPEEIDISELQILIDVAEACKDDELAAWILDVSIRNKYDLSIAMRAAALVTNFTASFYDKEFLQAIKDSSEFEFKNLRHLALQNCVTLTDEDLQFLLASSPRLQSINISWTHINGRAFTSGNAQLQNLIEVNLNACESLQEVNLQALLQKASLQEINLCSSGITGQAFSSETVNLQNLVVVDLRNNVNLVEAFLQQLLEKSPSANINRLK